MATSITQKILILCAVALLIPTLAGLAAYTYLRQGIIAKYDGCVASLTSEERS
jgi:hypothetical protein